MRENTRPKSNLLIQIFLGKAVVAEFELRRPDILQVGVEDTQRIEISDVMASNLVGSDEQLNLGQSRYKTLPGVETRMNKNLQMIVELCSLACIKRRSASDRLR